MVVELHKSFTNYGPNKHRNCNWVVSHLRITEFYDFYDETNSPVAPLEKPPISFSLVMNLGLEKAKDM